MCPVYTIRHITMWSHLLVPLLGWTSSHYLQYCIKDLYVQTVTLMASCQHHWLCYCWDCDVDRICQGSCLPCHESKRLRHLGWHKDDPRFSIQAGITCLLVLVNYMPDICNLHRFGHIHHHSFHLCFGLDNAYVERFQDFRSQVIKSGLSSIVVFIAIPIFGQDLMQDTIRFNEALPNLKTYESLMHSMCCFWTGECTNPMTTWRNGFCWS